MATAAKLGQTISEPLSWEAICDRHPNQWVCLVEIDRVVPNGFDFRTARVIGHGRTRREPLEQAKPWRDQYRSIGHYFTGEIELPYPRVLT